MIRKTSSVSTSTYTTKRSLARDLVVVPRQAKNWSSNAVDRKSGGVDQTVVFARLLVCGAVSRNAAKPVGAQAIVDPSARFAAVHVAEGVKHQFRLRGKPGRYEPNLPIA
jgi:hypothetical protein